MTPRIGMALLLLAAPSPALAQSYIDEEPVAVRDYDGDLMEPFLSRDGRYLFFNNRNDPADKTDLHVAHAAGDGSFVYDGPLTGANSQKLDGVPSMDKDGRFYFVSTRSYDKTKSTIHVGTFAADEVHDVALVGGDVSRRKAFWFNMDSEISADGERLYSTDNKLRFLIGGGVGKSDLFVAEKRGGGFYRLPNSRKIMATINTPNKLEYAAALTADERTMFFNRTDLKALRKGDPEGVGIYMATRPDRAAPFGEPRRIEAITGFVEGATISPDACVLYYHRKTGDQFRLYRVTREDCVRP